MRNIEIGGYIRISKKEAEKRYNAGEIIRLCACKVSPVNMWSVYVDCQKEEFNPDTDSPLNINGYSVYVTAQNEEGIKKELAAVEGCSPADLVLYVFEGYTRIPQYKAV